MRPILLCFNIIIIAFLMNGCVNTTPKPKKVETLENLQDVSLSVDTYGNVIKKEFYTAKDNETNTTVKKVKTETLTKPKEYERVPSFDTGYKKTLSLKGKKKKSVSIDGDNVKISVEGIPLNEFIDLVFGHVLKLNYTIDESVKKMKSPVTLNMQKPQKANEFYKVVKQILLLNGVGIRNENNILFVYKSGKASNGGENNDIYIGYGDTIPNNLEDTKNVILFVPTYYIKPRSMYAILTQSGVRDVHVSYLIKGIPTFKGKAVDIRKALEIKRLMDRPYMSGKTPYLINFDNVSVDNFIGKMKKIFALNGINVVDTPSQGGIAMLPLQELNMLYVISSKQEWIKMLLYWKAKLDIPVESAEEPRLYIYHVKNRKADELAVAIKAVLGLSKKQTQIKDTKFKQTANKKSKKTQNTKVSKNLLISATNYTQTVTADKDTNILMIKMTPKDYKIFLPFMQELDKLPLQTLVEVTVANVDMTDTFSLGFEYALRNQSANLVKDTLDITGGGSGLGIVFRGNYLDATINAFAQKQLLDIVSRPRILILNNNTGSINVGTQVPIITSETSATDTTAATPTINRNITYRTTGINLGLTPTINSNGVLTMNISIDLSEAQLNDTSGIDSPLIVNRTLNTVAVINSGDTILIGGLISENKSKTRGGIPFLKDIPYLGTIFSNVSNKTTKTELIMLIRPTIIKTRQEISQETYKFKKILNVLETINL